MNELFLQLCAGVAVALEALKPTVRKVFNIADTDTPVYQAAIWALAMLIGIAGAFAFQVNMAPSFLNLPTGAGFVFTGIISAFGSEVAHRILEVLESISAIFQNQAAKKAA